MMVDPDGRMAVSSGGGESPNEKDKDPNAKLDYENRTIYSKKDKTSSSSSSNTYVHGVSGGLMASQGPSNGKRKSTFTKFQIEYYTPSEFLGERRTCKNGVETDCEYVFSEEVIHETTTIRIEWKKDENGNSYIVGLQINAYANGTYIEVVSAKVDPEDSEIDIRLKLFYNEVTNVTETVTASVSGSTGTKIKGIDANGTLSYNYKRSVSLSNGNSENALYFDVILKYDSNGEIVLQHPHSGTIRGYSNVYSELKKNFKDKKSLKKVNKLNNNIYNNLHLRYLYGPDKPN